MKTIYEFILNNIGAAPYDGVRSYIVDFYPELKIDFASLPEYFKDKAKNDLRLFEEAEKNRAKKQTISVGDFIQRKDGQITQVGIFLTSDGVQDTHGGSFHINQCGTGSYSGGFTGDVFNVKNLVFTGECKPFDCWIFSEFWAGANRGVYSTISAKVWMEV